MDMAIRVPIASHYRIDILYRIWDIAIVIQLLV